MALNEFMSIPALRPLDPNPSDTVAYFGGGPNRNLGQARPGSAVSRGPVPIFFLPCSSLFYIVSYICTFASLSSVNQT